MSASHWKFQHSHFIYNLKCHYLKRNSPCTYKALENHKYDLIQGVINQRPVSLSLTSKLVPELPPQILWSLEFGHSLFTITLFGLQVVWSLRPTSRFPWGGLAPGVAFLSEIRSLFTFFIFSWSSVILSVLFWWK